MANATDYFGEKRLHWSYLHKRTVILLSDVSSPPERSSSWVPADTGCTSHWFLLYRCGNQTKPLSCEKAFSDVMTFLCGLCAQTWSSIPIKSVCVFAHSQMCVCVCVCHVSNELLSQQGARCHNSSCKVLIWGCKEFKGLKASGSWNVNNYNYMHAITHAAGIMQLRQ